MKHACTIALWLGLAAPAGADIFYRADATGSYCVWIRNSARTVSLKTDLAATSGDYAKDYVTTDAQLVTAGLTTSNMYPGYFYEVYATPAASVTTADTPIAVGSFRWNGVQMVDPLAPENATATANVNSGAIDANINWVDGSAVEAGEDGLMEVRVAGASAEGANEIFAALTSAQTVAGSVGELLVHFLDAPVSDAGGIPVEDFAEEIFTDGRWADVSDAALAIEGKLPSASAKIAGEGAAAKNLDQVTADVAWPTIAPTNVSRKRTWFAGPDGLHASNVVTVRVGFHSTLAVAPELSSDDAGRVTADLRQVVSVTITGPDTVTASDFAISADHERGHFNTSSIDVAGTYTVEAVVATDDDQEITLIGTLKVE